MPQSRVKPSAVQRIRGAVKVHLLRIRTAVATHVQQRYKASTESCRSVRKAVKPVHETINPHRKAVELVREPVKRALPVKPVLPVMLALHVQLTSCTD